MNIPRVRRSSLLPLLAALVVGRLAAGEIPPPWTTPPGWTETAGGQGGQVIRVTTLAADGPGSLREAIAVPGPRVIEFAVGGTIDLDGKGLRIAQPFLTLAAETAPTPGITLVNGEVAIVTHDVIVRHLRVRAGTHGRAHASGWDEDGLETGLGAHDVIVDHCSLTWATDENLTASGLPFVGNTPDEWRANTSHRITFNQCIIGEGLNDSTHSKGPHSKGTLVHDNVTDIAIIGNLYISNVDRNPLFKAGVRGAFVNNVIANPGQRIIQYGFVPSQWRNRELQPAALAIAGNVVRKGPDSAPEMAFFEVWPEPGLCDFYLQDNLLFDAAGKPLPVTLGARDRTRYHGEFLAPVPGGSGYEYRLVPYTTSGTMRQVEAPPVWPPRLQARPASETTAWVLAEVGARPWDRDEIDRRLIEEARTGGGRIVDWEKDAGEPLIRPMPLLLILP